MPFWKNANRILGNFPADPEGGRRSLRGMPSICWKNWWIAIRPKTLPASLAPVLIGTAMAAGDGVHHLPTAAVCAGVALLMQIGTNLSNDYFDFRNGADTLARIGPVRVTQSGLMKPRVVRDAFILVFALAALGSVELVLRGGWPIAVLAALSILSGIFYTAGPRPLGYLGLGEVFVLVFFGPVAVGGTYYVQSREMNLAVLLAGLAAGLLSAAILAVNNLRDIDTDRAAGKLTLAARFGRTFARAEYFFCVTGAALMPVLIYALTQDHIETLAAVLTLPAAFAPLHAVFTQTDGPALNRALSRTGAVLLLFSFLFSMGWMYADLRF